MKESPGSKKLEEVLRSSKIVAGGFLGDDVRSVDQIISEDLAAVEEKGFEAEELAERMREITNEAKMYLGNPVVIEDKLEVVSEDYKGVIVCPWPHSGRFDKRITTVKRLDTGKAIRWTDLNIHLIAKHGFFEGRGARFRIEPVELIEIIF